MSLISITSQALGPATVAFLDAVDLRMNSNTLLLAVSSDMSFTDYETEKIFTEWLQSGLFSYMFMESAKLRGWQRKAAGIHFDNQIYIDMKDPADFINRLWWMLQVAPSPYDKHIPAAQAAFLIYNFVCEMLGQDVLLMDNSEKPPRFSQANRIRFQFFDLAINQLMPLLNEYFDDLGGDSATVWRKNNELYLLLTNGSD